MKSYNLKLVALRYIQTELGIKIQAVWKNCGWQSTEKVRADIGWLQISKYNLHEPQPEVTCVESETEEDDDEGVTMDVVLVKESLLLDAIVMLSVHVVTIDAELSAVVVIPQVPCLISAGGGSLSLISFKLWNRWNFHK